MQKLFKFFNEERKDPVFQIFFFLSLILLTLEYFGWQGPFHRLFRMEGWYRSLTRNDRYLYAQIYTTISFGLLFFIGPILFHFLFKKDNDESLLDHGLRLPKQSDNWKPYLYLFLIMVPFLLMACSQPSFYNFYPLYRPNGLKDWLLFELIYLPQFIFVEFFFRGYFLFRLEKVFKLRAIIIMTLPYALIHIHKPFGEAIGSIFAGVALGYLALKGRSIVPGILLHMLIALSADALGLYFSKTVPF